AVSQAALYLSITGDSEGRALRGGKLANWPRSTIGLVRRARKGLRRGTKGKTGTIQPSSGVEPPPSPAVDCPTCHNRGLPSKGRCRKTAWLRESTPGLEPGTPSP